MSGEAQTRVPMPNLTRSGIVSPGVRLHPYLQAQQASYYQGLVPQFAPYGFYPFSLQSSSSMDPLHPAFLGGSPGLGYHQSTYLNTPVAGQSRREANRHDRRPRSVLSIAEILRGNSDRCNNAVSEGDFHPGARTTVSSPLELSPRAESLVEGGHAARYPSPRSTSPEDRRHVSSNGRASKDRRNKKAGNQGKRVRTIFTPEQLSTLEDRFRTQQYMIGPDRSDLARYLNLREQQVKVWFQNRRIKWRKQTAEQEAARLAKVDMYQGIDLDIGSDGEEDSNSGSNMSFSNNIDKGLNNNISNHNNNNNHNHNNNTGIGNTKNGSDADFVEKAEDKVDTNHSSSSDSS